MGLEIRTVSSVILVGTCGRLILQQRDDVPGILHPGMIGLFGGHREEGESPLACAQRELEEEIGQVLPFERLEPLMQCRTVFQEMFELRNDVFVVRDIPSDALVVTEGKPLFAGLGELCALYGRMTPATSYAVRYYASAVADQPRKMALPAKQQQPEHVAPVNEQSQQQQ